MTPKSTRRDFLKGKAAADALAATVEESLPARDAAGQPSEQAAEACLLRVSRRAMACEFEVLLGAGQHERGTEAALDALDLVERLEEQMSFFRETSEISRLNRTAAVGPVEVEPRLFELLELAIELQAASGGALDITAGALSEVWGFSRRAGTIPDDQQLAEAMKNVGPHLIELDPQQRTVYLRRPGVRLNLGSIGKGHALDRCGQQLLAAGVGDFLLHGGQSSVLAQGSAPQQADSSSPAASDGWTVGLRHPLRRGLRLAELRLRDRALGTSGTAMQFFRHKGRRYGHILDPRTGRPPQGVLSATAIAPSAAVADALSTAFFVLGAAGTREFCRTRPDIGAVLVCPQRRSGGIEIESVGLQEDDLRILTAP